MSQLNDQRCIPCSKGAPPATEEETAAYMQQLSEWQIVDVDSIRQLQRVFPFKNFVQALAFTNRIGTIAEEEGHHPALLTEWGRVTVRWWTHKIGGLHGNDFVMAAKTDRLFPD